MTSLLNFVVPSFSSNTSPLVPVIHQSSSQSNDDASTYFSLTNQSNLQQLIPTFEEESLAGRSFFVPSPPTTTCQGVCRSSLPEYRDRNQDCETMCANTSNSRHIATATKNAIRNIEDDFDTRSPIVISNRRRTNSNGRSVSPQRRGGAPRTVSFPIQQM